MKPLVQKLLITGLFASLQVACSQGNFQKLQDPNGESASKFQATQRPSAKTGEAVCTLRQDGREEILQSFILKATQDSWGGVTYNGKYYRAQRTSATGLALSLHKVTAGSSYSEAPLAAGQKNEEGAVLLAGNQLINCDLNDYCVGLERNAGAQDYEMIPGSGMKISVDPEGSVSYLNQSSYLTTDTLLGVSKQNVDALVLMTLALSADKTNVSEKAVAMFQKDSVTIQLEKINFSCAQVK